MSEMDCEGCEQALQPYLDRELSDQEAAKVKRHLADCEWCDNRYKFEAKLRRLVRQSVVEPMEPALKARLANLRLEL